MGANTQLILSMMSYYEGDPKRIQHFTKVYEYASMIGQMEKLKPDVQHILEVAAITHDIGIKPAMEKYGSCTGDLQEMEGPAVAQGLLISLLYKPEVVERVCYLIGHHHTYDHIDGMDYQILVEADFLVNIYEDNLGKESALKARDKIFKTASGIKLLNTMYGLEPAEEAEA